VAPAYGNSRLNLSQTSAAATKTLRAASMAWNASDHSDVAGSP
jgi:hypothetical protein